jgi:hypothetical protein
VGVYSQTWTLYLPQELLEYNFAPLWSFHPTGSFVELLWTLRGHSLGQSKDQVKGVSCLHLILFGNHSELLWFLLWQPLGALRIGGASSTVSLLHGYACDLISLYSYVLAALAYYRGIISYFPKVKA